MQALVKRNEMRLQTEENELNVERGRINVLFKITTFFKRIKYWYKKESLGVDDGGATVKIYDYSGKVTGKRRKII